MINLNQLFHSTGAANVSIDVDIPQDLFGAEALIARMPGTIEDIVIEAAAFWEAEAGRRLKTSRKEYQKSIHFTQEGDQWSLTLEGKVANMIEQGFDKYDMKPGLLSGPNSRPGPVKIPTLVRKFFIRTGRPKATRYNIVPIPQPGGGDPLYRTVTDASPASSWIHPGFKGVHIAESVADEMMNHIIQDKLGRMVDEVIS